MATPPATPPHGVQHDGAAPTSPEQQQIQMMHGYAAPMPDGPAAPTAPQQHGAQYGGAGYDNAMAQYQYQYWFNAYAQYYARYPAAINAAQI